MENDAKVTVSFAGGGSIRDAVTAVEFAVETKRMSELIWAAAFAHVAWDWRANTIEFRGTVAVEAADSMVATYLAYRATVPK